jgi:hypothetical protein
MADSEVIHVAIAPPPNLDTYLVRSVAAVINKSSYDTRLLLAGDIPKILAHYDNAQTAESIARNLRDLGLAAIACRDSELRQPSQGFMARTMEFREKEIVFRNIAGQEKRTGQDDVFLILQGKMEALVEVETTKSKAKFSLTRTLLAGGIPIWHKVDEKTTARSVQAEYFVRLYNRQSASPSIEILQHHTDYSFLGAKVATSSLANFRAIVQKVQETFPQALVDSRLLKPLLVTPHPSQVWQDVDTNCKLIYLFHTVGGGLDSRT